MNPFHEYPGEAAFKDKQAIDDAYTDKGVISDVNDVIIDDPKSLPYYIALIRKH